MNENREINKASARDNIKKELKERLRLSPWGESENEFNRILVPTDFSKYARHAAEYAVALALKLNAEVILLHTYHFIPSDSSLIINIDDVIIESAQTALQEEQTEIQKINPSIKIDSICQEGYLNTGIESIIKLKKINLVIMGTKGAHGFTRNFLGSNTSQLIGKIKAPLMVVPVDSTIHHLKKIAVAVDIQSQNLPQSFYPIRVLSNTLDAKVDFVSVVSKTDDIASHNSVSLVDELRVIFNNPNLYFDHIISEDIEKGIMKYLTTNEIDLLVVLNKKRGFMQKFLHKSISSALVKHSSTPIIVLSNN